MLPSTRHLQVILSWLCPTLQVGPGRSFKADVQETVRARHCCLQVLSLDGISQRCCDLLPNGRVPRLDGVKAISPTCPVRGWTHSTCTAQTEAPNRERQSSDVPRSVRYVTTQQSAEAPSDGIVMFNRENRSKQIICPRTHTEEQHQACTLQIGDCSNPLQQLPVGSGRLLEKSPHVLRSPSGVPSTFTPCSEGVQDLRATRLRPGRPAELQL